MDFSLPADLVSYLARLDAFVAAEIAPLQAQDDNQRFFDHRREWARTDFEGGEINARINAYACWDDRLDAQAGLRYLELNDKFEVVSRSVYAVSPLLQPVLSGASLGVVDEFRTRNEFYGGQIGLEATWRRLCWDVRVRFCAPLHFSFGSSLVRMFAIQRHFGNGVLS